MAAVTSAGSTINTTAGNKTVVATPAVGDLIVIFCFNTGRTVGQFPTVSDNNADGLGSYGKFPQGVGDAVKAASADSMWMFIRRGGLIGSATSTTFTMAQASDSGGGLQVFRISGMSICGLGAVRGGGAQNNQALGSTPTPVLARRLGITSLGGTQAALTTNPVISAVFNASNPANTTIRGTPAYTSAVNTGYATPAAGYRSMSIDSGETASSIAWGGTSASAWGAFAFEFDASVPVYDYVLRNQIDSDRIQSRDAVMRKATW